jgi:ribosomal protein L11 methyltransferase
MPWLRLKLRVGHDHLDAYTETLEDLGAVAVTLTDAGNEPKFETEWDKVPLWSDLQVIALFPDDTDAQAVVLQAAQRLGIAAPRYETDLLGDDDWATAWKANYRPVHVGRRLWICPSWCEPPEPLAVNIILDPGMAFGTGTHPTTASCLAWLADQDLTNKTVLDYGCGSGILAVAALKLGARSAIATDIDPQSLAVTRENAERNGVLDRLQITLPADLSQPLTADVVVANILAGALIDLAPRLIGHVVPHGHLVLSGVLASQAQEVADHYRPAIPLTIHLREEWALLAGTRVT